MLNQRPTLFIGSSSEGLPVAEAFQVLLDHSCEVTIWSQGVFGLSQGTLESLVNVLDDFDFALLALTPDDLTTSRDKQSAAPRDNVLFELGLFMGSLGRDRTFILYDRTLPLKLPSDLAGVSAATYAPHASGNLQAALGAAATSVKLQVAKLGLRRPIVQSPPPASTLVTGHVLPAGNAAALGHSIEHHALAHLGSKLGLNIRRDFVYESQRGQVQFSGFADGSGGVLDRAFEVALSSTNYFASTCESAVTRFLDQLERYQALTGRRIGGTLAIVIPKKDEVGWK